MCMNRLVLQVRELLFKRVYEYTTKVQKCNKKIFIDHKWLAFLKGHLFSYTYQIFGLATEVFVFNVSK